MKKTKSCWEIISKICCKWRFSWAFEELNCLGQMISILQFYDSEDHWFYETKSAEIILLIKMLKDEEDRTFLPKNYYYKAFLTGKILRKIEERLENWDLERISLMDRLILITAITEIDNFPLTQQKVIINEYIEVSKCLLPIEVRFLWTES